MKKVLIILYCVLLAGVLPAQQIAKNTPGKPAAGGDLRPSQQQAKVQQLITQILTQGHYRKLALDDSLSSAIFDRYLQSLDNNKVIFLASDIAQFEKYRTAIDDDLKQGELTPAYTIFNTFKNRFDERMNYVSALLDKPFDFTVDETYNTDREKAPWPKSCPATPILK